MQKTAKSSYLVIKTGKSGAKLNTLYTTKLATELGDIPLTGEYRLTGGWYRDIMTACKMQGIKGTLSVVKHTPENADLLLQEWQKTFLMLRNNIDWQPVARIDISEADLADITDKSCKQAIELAIDAGDIVYDSNGKLAYAKPELSYKSYMANVKRIKQERRQNSARIAAELLPLTIL